MSARAETALVYLGAALAILSGPALAWLTGSATACVYAAIPGAITFAVKEWRRG